MRKLREEGKNFTWANCTRHFPYAVLAFVSLVSIVLWTVNVGRNGIAHDHQHLARLPVAAYLRSAPLREFYASPPSLLAHLPPLPLDSNKAVRVISSRTNAPFYLLFTGRNQRRRKRLFLFSPRWIRLWLDFRDAQNGKRKNFLSIRIILVNYYCKGIVLWLEWIFLNVCDSKFLFHISNNFPVIFQQTTVESYKKRTYGENGIFNALGRWKLARHEAYTLEGTSRVNCTVLSWYTPWWHSQVVVRNVFHFRLLISCPPSFNRAFRLG